MSLEADLARENISIAPRLKRVKAYILDEILIAMIVSLATGEQASQIGDLAAMANDVTLPINVLLSFFLWVAAFHFVYHLVFVAIYGATLGKMWQKITIVSVKTLEKPSFAAALARSASRILSDICMGYGFLWAFLNPLSQTWHDKISKTIVINA